MMDRSVLFIVNPISGSKIKKDRVIAGLEAKGCNIRFTEYAGHATVLAKEAQEDIVVAVGGDGTVNEVAKGLVGTGKILGIIPCGSGDGLAMTLGISRHFEKAYRTIFNGDVHNLDWGTINGREFFSVCGVGFDALVSEAFALKGKRGLTTYIDSAIKEWIEFKPEHYSLNIDGQAIETDAAMITVANSTQWGNGALVAPDALTDDGLLDVTVIHPFHSLEIPHLAALLMTGRLGESDRVSFHRGKEILIHRSGPGAAHCDGDFIEEGADVTIRLGTGKLNVICPKPRARVSVEALRRHISAKAGRH